MPQPDMRTPAQQLEAIMTPTDRLAVGPEGDLLIEDVSATQLLKQFGSPLYVFSEHTLRDNYRRIRRAFSDAWPGPVNIMYAIKANTNLAVRAILHQEGAGGDCFSEGEIHATFSAGADADKIALNGGLKSEESLRIAVERGMTVNIDAESEIDQLRAICRRLKKRVCINIRLKPLSDAYNQTHTDYFGGDQLADYVRRVKWGFSLEAAVGLIDRIRNIPELDLRGFSFHIGRVAQGSAFFHHYGRAVGSMVTDLYRETGIAPRILDIGGGWARERDPESKSLAMHTTPAEESAQAACGQILEQLKRAGLAVPDLWVEPGRFIVGNASVLLSKVGTIKHDLGLTWVHIDASTNQLPRIDTSGSAHHVLAASGMERPADQIVDVVGPICIDSIMGRDVAMPAMEKGDIVVILDAGMYSESASTQFNSLPRPATVLVNGSEAEIIKERERVDDVFRLHRIPDRLANE
jgi:diaminopimelate decarboxylase